LHGTAEFLSDRLYCRSRSCRRYLCSPRGLHRYLAALYPYRLSHLLVMVGRRGVVDNRCRDRTVGELPARVRVLASGQQMIEALCASCDVVIGAALVAGGAAPMLISRQTVATMKPGSVIVDVSIDQGGCAETSRPTTHSRPTYVVEGVVHYCVANMPGAVPRTSTFALNNATRPFILALADHGVRRALIDDIHLQNGLNIYDGRVTCHAVANALGLPYIPAMELLGAP